jgi:hypothetical protein
MNINVGIELGYAIHSHGEEQVLLVLNEHYGGRDFLPFHLQDLGGPITYRLSRDATREEIDAEKARLRGMFVAAIREFLKKPVPAVGIRRRRHRCRLLAGYPAYLSAGVLRSRRRLRVRGAVGADHQANGRGDGAGLTGRRRRKATRLIAQPTQRRAGAVILLVQARIARFPGERPSVQSCCVSCSYMIGCRNDPAPAIRMPSRRKYWP